MTDSISVSLSHGKQASGAYVSCGLALNLHINICIHTNMAVQVMTLSILFREQLRVVC